MCSLKCFPRKFVSGRLLHRKQKMRPAGFGSGISIRIPTGIIEELFYSSARDPKIWSWFEFWNWTIIKTCYLVCTLLVICRAQNFPEYQNLYNYSARLHYGRINRNICSFFEDGTKLKISFRDEATFTVSKYV